MKWICLQPWTNPAATILYQMIYIFNSLTLVLIYIILVLGMHILAMQPEQCLLV